ncbi:catalase family peroxidase [Cupriavidus sp. 2TAF22]|uniref:catalase family peroxidase n=1 Tax=unclassified Cupriavidus TaxID=2640874 RepID=UPI003F9309BC
MTDNVGGPLGQKPKLSAGAVAIRYGGIGVATLVLAGAFAYAGGWLSPDRLTQDKVVSGFEAANGKHAGFRRNHAKGLCATGWFDSNGSGSALSQARLLARGRVPVVGRIAFAGGMPFVADGPSLVRSLALQFKPDGGQEWRTAMVDIPVFPFSTVQAFYDQMMASIPDPKTGKPDPEKAKAFAAAHPDFVAAVGIVGHRAVSSGFSNSTYNALDTFLFVDRAGIPVPVRWSAEPVQPFAPVGKQQGADPNYLFDALISEVAQHPVQWKMVVTVGQPGDPVNPDKAWPDGRQKVDIGTVTLDKVSSEDSGTCTDINFDPTILPAGIETSADDIPSARSAAYSRSFTVRENERREKPTSAVTPQEVNAGAKS